MKTAIWISYDLGVQGDYDHLYAWLDNHEALECGDSMAYLLYEFSKGIDDNAFLNRLKIDLEKYVHFNPGNRIYVIRRVEKNGEIHYNGRFLIGKRKASPWEGYGDRSSNQIEDGNQ